MSRHLPIWLMELLWDRRSLCIRLQLDLLRESLISTILFLLQSWGPTNCSKLIRFNYTICIWTTFSRPLPINARKCYPMKVRIVTRDMAELTDCLTEDNSSQYHKTHLRLKVQPWKLKNHWYIIADVIQKYPENFAFQLFIILQ